MGLLVRPAWRTSWTDQLNGPAGQTNSFYLKPWPVRIFNDSTFSLYIVAASESDQGLVLFAIFFTVYICLKSGDHPLNTVQQNKWAMSTAHNHQNSSVLNYVTSIFNSAIVQGKPFFIVKLMNMPVDFHLYNRIRDVTNWRVEVVTNYLNPALKWYCVHFV